MGLTSMGRSPPQGARPFRTLEVMDVEADEVALFGRPADRADELRVRRGAVRFLRIPAHRFVMVDGSGAPGDEVFAARLPGLYTVAFGLHFALKRRGITARVGPLEGLWWRDDGVTDLDVILQDPGASRWTLLIGLPDEASDAEISEQLAAGRGKVSASIAASLRAEVFDEGPVAQILHVGPYAEERPSIERLHRAVAAEGLRSRGRHHELYLGDPRRSAPERLRTLLRQPVEWTTAGAVARGGRR